MEGGHPEPDTVCMKRMNWDPARDGKESSPDDSPHRSPDPLPSSSSRPAPGGEASTVSPSHPPPFHVVLVEPDIPHNTGAVGRLCVGLGIPLHLVQPLGFSLRDEKVRRCGLDYWPHVDLRIHRSWAAYLEEEKPVSMFFASTRGGRSIYACRFQAGAHLVFGSEHAGLPPELYARYADRLVRIPMPGLHARSLNLANAVAVLAYEAHRQIDAAESAGGEAISTDSRPRTS
jgi:tRNA (cytidine/uridine-2'-O-)-methyltransferase